MNTVQTKDPKYTTPVYAMVWSRYLCGLDDWGSALYIDGRYAEGFDRDTKEEAVAAVRAEAAKRGVLVEVVHDRTSAYRPSAKK